MAFVFPEQVIQWAFRRSCPVSARGQDHWSTIGIGRFDIFMPKKPLNLPNQAIFPDII
jgi:hypothetical protein